MAEYDAHPTGSRTTPDAPVGASDPRYRRWLWVLSAALVGATLILVAIGGHVTSSDAGMAVPEGFFTGPYWSLISPLEYWWHDMGRRLEHSHRLKGYVVGGITIAVTVSLLRTQGRRRWLKVLGVGLLVFVVAQGALGIVRVSFNSNPFVAGAWFAAIHGVTGQLFLCLTVLVAAATGRFWMQHRRRSDADASHLLRPRWRVAPLVLLGLLLVQLTLGSAVRHSGSALAIPDWPTHYGSWAPPMSQAQLDEAVSVYPADRLPERYGRATVISEAVPYTTAQVHLHFAHRLGAYTVTLFGLGYVGWLFRRYRGVRERGAVWWPAGLFAGLLLLQVSLGVMTVWSGEHATMATAHQTVGAGLFAAATWLAIRLHLVRAGSARSRDVPVAAGDALDPDDRAAAGGSGRGVAAAG